MLVSTNLTTSSEGMLLCFKGKALFKTLFSFCKGSHELKNSIKKPGFKKLGFFVAIILYSAIQLNEVQINLVSICVHLWFIISLCTLPNCKWLYFVKQQLFLVQVHKAG